MVSLLLPLAPISCPALIWMLLLPILRCTVLFLADHVIAHRQTSQNREALKGDPQFRLSTSAACVGSPPCRPPCAAIWHGRHSPEDRSTTSRGGVGRGMWCPSIRGRFRRVILVSWHARSHSHKRVPRHQFVPEQRFRFPHYGTSSS